MSASCTMLPDLSPQTTRAFADVTHHAVAGHAAIGQILISFVEDGKLMVSDDLSEEELDDLGRSGRRPLSADMEDVRESFEGRRSRRR